MENHFVCVSQPPVFQVMAVASGPAGPVLAGPVFAVKTAHAQGYVNGRGAAMRCDHSVPWGD